LTPAEAFFALKNQTKILFVHFIVVMSRRQTRSLTAVTKRSLPKRDVEDEQVSAPTTQQVQDDSDLDDYVPLKKQKRQRSNAKRQPVKKRSEKEKSESEDDWEEVASSRWCGCI